MRSLYIAAALCVGFAAPLAFGPAAYAFQAADVATADGALQAQIDAVMLNNDLTDAEVQEQIAALIAGAPDPVAASNLVIASIERAPAARRAALGGALAQAANDLAADQPEIAAAIQTAVATDAPADVQVAYATTTADVIETAAGGDIAGPVDVPGLPDALDAPDTPDTPDTPDQPNQQPAIPDALPVAPPEPNPAQAGSPT